MPQTVLVVDDHAEFRAAARSLLESEGFDVVAEAGTAVEAVDLARELHPAVVLLDIRLPDGDGLTVAETLALLPNAPEVVLVSSREARAYGARLRRTSARGFIAKSDLSGRALHGVLHGGVGPADRE